MESMKRLNQALEYVKQTLESQIDNAVFSQIAACPMAVFQRFFVLVTGTAFNEYVRLRKLSRAAEEILNSQNKLIDIALKYGYECVQLGTIGVYKNIKSSWQAMDSARRICLLVV